MIISAIENDYIHGVLKNIVYTAYKKIGIEVKFNYLPAQRSLEWANLGKTDGDLARTDKIEDKYTNLIKIPTPLITIKGVAFTKNIKRDIRAWEDLKGLSIGIRSGIRYSEVGTKGLDRIESENLSHLFNLLSRDRIDIAIADFDMGRYELLKNFKGSNIHIIGQPLNSALLFHYINKKNIELLPQLKSTFRDMMESGEIDSIREKAIQETLSR